MFLIFISRIYVKYSSVYMSTLDSLTWTCTHYYKKERKKESEVAQSCPTLCDPMDCSLSGSSIHRIFQARILEWVAISFSYLKWITNKDLLYTTWNTAQCNVATWMRRQSGEEWIHVHVWLSPFAIHLKLSQNCLSAIPQYKIKSFLKSFNKNISMYS